jgi:hypothetical protein
MSVEGFTIVRRRKGEDFVHTLIFRSAFSLRLSVWIFQGEKPILAGL